MRRFWLILLILWGTAVFVFVPRVLAHAELVSAIPAPGSSVEALTEIRLTFSEPIGPNGQIQLHQDFISAAELEPVVDPNDETVLVTAVPPLPDGVYTVQWSVISSDGHPISGSYSLGINSAPPQPDTPWYLTSWALLALLLGSFGTAALILRRWQPASVSGSGKDR